MKKVQINVKMRPSQSLQEAKGVEGRKENLPLGEQSCPTLHLPPYCQQVLNVENYCWKKSSFKTFQPGNEGEINFCPFHMGA